jgi:hypothetical protein
MTDLRRGPAVKAGAPGQVFTTARSASAITTMRNGKKHNSRVAASSTPRLMKSIDSSRRATDL